MKNCYLLKVSVHFWKNKRGIYNFFCSLFTLLVLGVIDRRAWGYKGRSPPCRIPLGFFFRVQTAAIKSNIKCLTHIRSVTDYIIHSSFLLDNWMLTLLFSEIRSTSTIDFSTLSELFSEFRSFVLTWRMTCSVFKMYTLVQNNKSTNQSGTISLVVAYTVH